MSIKIMSWVWEHSRQSGTNLLMLLAIADHSNEDGIAWPGIDHLAKKARLSRRQARRVIHYLADEKEIVIRPRFRNTHLYQFPGWKDGKYYSSQGVIDDPLNSSQGVMGDTLGRPLETARGSSVTIEGVTAMTPESSLTINESVNTTDWAFIWKRAAESLKLQLTDAAFDQWLGRATVCLSQSNGKLVLVVHNQQAVDWLSNRMSTLVDRTVSEIAEQPTHVEFVVNDKPPQDPDKTPNAAE